MVQVIITEGSYCVKKSWKIVWKKEQEKNVMVFDRS